jgi:hypothetical protein
MPNRIIKESICTSAEIHNLPAEAEIAFYRMIVNVDDYGRMEADPTVLRAKLFPRKIDQVTNSDMDYFLGLLSNKNSAGESLIFLYEVSGKKYLQISKWEEHQQIRAKRSKHPAPEKGQVLEGAYITYDQPPRKKTPKKKTKPTPEPDSIEMKLAGELKRRILENNPKARAPKDLTAWAIEIERMMRIDERTAEEVAAMIEFSQKDEFWHRVILSAANLRSKYDQLYLKSKRQPGGAEPRAWGNIREWLNEAEGGQAQ